MHRRTWNMQRSFILFYIESYGLGMCLWVCAKSHYGISTEAEMKKRANKKRRKITNDHQNICISMWKYFVENLKKMIKWNGRKMENEKMRKKNGIKNDHDNNSKAINSYHNIRYSVQSILWSMVHGVLQALRKFSIFHRPIHCMQWTFQRILWKEILKIISCFFIIF